MLWIKRSLLGLLALSVVLVGLQLFRIGTARPDFGLVLERSAISAPISIFRDESGIPHIFADSWRDAVFAIGYAQGQDRGWQLEFLRRAVRGRMSEIAGSAVRPLDEAFLHSGTAIIAEASMKRFDNETLDLMQAFTDGVNAAIAAGQYQASPEFVAAFVEPDPWTLSDTGAFFYVIPAQSLQDSKQFLWESLRADLGERIRALSDDYHERWPTLFRDIGALPDVTASTRAALQAAGLPEYEPRERFVAPSPEADRGTNFFVAGPDKTATAQPLLAVDPHLPLDAPSLLYPVAISLPDQRIRGGVWVTSPAMHFGQNDQIAWGMTNMYGLEGFPVLERLDPADPERYLTESGSEPFGTTRYELAPRGGSPYTITVRTTRHGIVVSDFDSEAAAYAKAQGDGLVVAMRSIPHEQGTTYLASGLKVPLAKDWETFRAAVSWHDASNTWVYADTAGNYGVQTAGSLLARRDAAAGDSIARGWLGEGAIAGVVPFEALPQALNPPQDFIADANSRIVPKDYPLFFTARASAPTRIQRINEVLERSSDLTIEDFKRLQTDAVSLRARELLDAVRSTIDVTALSSPAGELWTLLENWDQRMTAEQAAPLVFTAFEAALHARLVGTKVSNADYAASRGNALLLARILRSDERGWWCAGSASDTAPDCLDAVNSALLGTEMQLSERYGDNPSQWRWGSAHRGRFGHLYGLDFLPVIRDWTAPLVTTDSGPGTINAGGYVATEQFAYEQHGGAVWRQIIDLSNPDNSLFQFAPGVSGNPLSPHYDGNAEAWANGRYLSLARTRAELKDSGAPETRFMPSE